MKFCWYFLYFLYKYRLQGAAIEMYFVKEILKIKHIFILGNWKYWNFSFVNAGKKHWIFSHSSLYYLSILPKIFDGQTKIALLVQAHLHWNGMVKNSSSLHFKPCKIPDAEMGGLT